MGKQHRVRRRYVYKQAQIAAFQQELEYRTEIEEHNRIIAEQRAARGSQTQDLIVEKVFEGEIMHSELGHRVNHMVYRVTELQQEPTNFNPSKERM